jgi:hypothetical protein
MLRMHCPRALLLLFATLSTVLILAPANAATCTGDDNCRACKNCRYCRHCAKLGGTCGVCGSSRSMHSQEDQAKHELTKAYIKDSGDAIHKITALVSSHKQWTRSDLADYLVWKERALNASKYLPEPDASQWRKNVRILIEVKGVPW